MDNIKFDFKDDLNIKDIADILTVAWPGGMNPASYDMLKPETKRHFADHESVCTCSRSIKTWYNPDNKRQYCRVCLKERVTMR